MADNVSQTLSGSTSIAADEVVDATLGTVKVQFVKLMNGVIDATDKTAVSSGSVSLGVSAALPTGTNSVGSVKITDGSNSAQVNSAALQAASTANGCLLGEKGPRWFVSSTPAIATLATATKAAGGSGVSHVCDTITFSVGITNNVVANARRIIQLRDGATGAGTVLWSFTVFISPAGPNRYAMTITGLNLVGTANTAMTLEFDSTILTGYEDVSLAGYDIT